MNWQEIIEIDEKSLRVNYVELNTGTGMRSEIIKTISLDDFNIQLNKGEIFEFEPPKEGTILYKKDEHDKWWLARFKEHNKSIKHK